MDVVAVTVVFPVVDVLLVAEPVVVELVVDPVVWARIVEAIKARATSLYIFIKYLTFFNRVFELFFRYIVFGTSI